MSFFIIFALMLKEERHNIILEETSSNGSSSFQLLCKKLAVSEDTIRRDIRELDSRGLLKAVRGGAVSVSRIPHHYREREHTDIEQKKVIAKKALTLIKNKQVLFFDGGTSVLELAKILPVDLNVTIITNSFPVANALEDHPLAEVIFLGGRLNKMSFATFGHETLKGISKFKVDIYFFGICSISPDSLSCKDLEDAELKLAMMQHSVKTVGLCTFDKLNSESTYFITETKELDILITEKDDPSLHTKPFTKLGIEIL
ncbi:DeoR family transcriptional regulator [Sphingobacterium yanglingense]|uniref:DeoR family transcriptional regulator n=2 Tax=Sphingobacterium yanglingense TaxID=1437280 RepID=A0A4R6WHM8_9SPHI|nr:DeoR family transcriptional regulator [Sphingobacterium yanglingense]